MSPRGLLVAAAASGAGKTTVTAGLLAAFGKGGLAVRAAKSGPDYIDGGFHRIASGAPVVNLDSFSMPPEVCRAVAAEAAAGADLLLVEGAMGLFDGVPGPEGRTGAAADIAAALGVPVLLVLDPAGQSQTAGAIARGLATHRSDVRIAGVILNRVASARHRSYAAGAIEAAGVPVLGALPRGVLPALPARHLGLVQAEEQADIAARIAAIGDAVAEHVDLDRVRAAAAPLRGAEAGAGPPTLPPPGERIALARDAAFSFVYEHILAGWRRAGAAIVPFSPLAGEPPPDHCDCCWLPGGYPELHAGRLAAAHSFLAGLRRFAETRPVHGECGGFMVLGEALVDATGTRHVMAGLLGHTTSFAERRMTLGYRIAEPLAPSPAGRPGDVLRGHEFHYSTVVARGGDAPLMRIADGEGRPLGEAGARRGHVSGSYFHVIAREPG